MAELKALGLAENTLVVFTSDNGPHNESNHNLARFDPAGPLTGIKRSLTDGGIRVPLIAWWPGKVKPGTVSDHVGSFADWMATAAELASAKGPAGGDSVSFAPTLLGTPEKQAQHEFLYWEFHEGGFKQAALYQAGGRAFAARPRRAGRAVRSADRRRREDERGRPAPRDRGGHRPVSGDCPCPVAGLGAAVGTGQAGEVGADLAPAALRRRTRVSDYFPGVAA